MPLIGGAVGGGLSLAGGIIGASASGDARRAARDAASNAVSELMNMGMPPDLSARLVLEKYKQEGTYTPELEQDILMQTSAMSGVQADKQAVEAQKRALESISKRAQVGLTPEERAQAMRMQQETAKGIESARLAGLQNLAQRGQAGSGAELAAQLAAQQQGAQQASQNALDISSLASQRALAALGQQGSLAGNLREQSFGEGARKAEAQDVLGRFNVQNQRDVQARNIGAKNTAQQQNLATAQRISEMNVSQANEETRRQAEAKRQRYLDELALRQARSGAQSQAAATAAGQAKDIASMWSGIGQGAGGIAAGMGKK